uniref:Uncharacterized protein n=1 Tax=Arundo donax TaxID=35708 RepID=A0A0A9CTZ6_ARUDO
MNSLFPPPRQLGWVSHTFNSIPIISSDSQPISSEIICKSSGWWVTFVELEVLS